MSNFSLYCEKGPVVLKTINWTSELDEVFIDNLMNRDNTLKWQYFGSPDAVFRTYPGMTDGPWLTRYMKQVLYKLGFEVGVIFVTCQGC